MSFFEELKRRNVIRVGLAYAAAAWFLAQVAELLLDAFGAPAWALRALLIGLAIGFPITLVIAWIYELTPEGIRVDEDGVSDAAPGAERRLDRIIIGVLAAAVSILLVDRFYLSSDPGFDSVATQSIAVLPFANMSDDSDHFTDGLSEELLNVLAKIPQLKVAGRTSSFAFKGRNEDLREIGDALDVEHLLEGSVRRAGDQLRITAQLIKVDDGFHVWSETYDRELADVFDIQDDVASRIAEALQVRLTPDANRPTRNVEAYALYLEALSMSDLPTGKIDEVIELLDRALELDPEFARAHLLKAMAYWQAAGWTLDQGLARGLVYGSASDALALDPGLDVARVFVVAANPTRESWIDYFAALDVAIAKEPNNLRLIDTMSNALFVTGYYAESLAYARQIVEIDPLSPLGYARIGYCESALGNRDVAIEHWRRAADLGAIEILENVILSHLVAGDLEKAIELEEERSLAIGWDPADARPLYESFFDPVNGKTALEAFMQSWATDALSRGDVAASIGIHSLYIPFGYLDDVWAVIEKDRAENETTWLNSEYLLFVGALFPETGFTGDSRFVDDVLVEIWEARGAPDRCSKIDGEWTCN